MADPIEPVTEASLADQGSKYIRTFHGDMIVAQKGGTPDWAPVEEHKKLLEEAPVVAAKPVPLSAPAVAVPSAPAKPEWNEAVREATIARLHEQMAADAARGEHRSTERSQPIGIPEEGPVPLHTYSEDFRDRVTGSGASTATILAAEQDAGPHTQGVVEESPMRKVAFAVAGVLLLAFGSAGAYLAYSAYLVRQAPIDVSQEAVAPIFVDERTEVSGAGSVLLESVLAAAEPPLAPSTIRFLYSNNATTTRDSIFVTAQIPAPDILRRNIVGTGSMVGVVQTAGEQSTFFILAVSSYNQTFGGMLAWEKTSMLRDLEEFYRPYPAPVVPVAIVATTTATSTAAKPATTTPAATSTPPAPAFRAGFYDEVVANHDVRVYKDAQNRTVLLYGYPDQKTLVIARSAAAFTEIVDRLRNSRTQ